MSSSCLLQKVHNDDWFKIYFETDLLVVIILLRILICSHCSLEHFRDFWIILKFFCQSVSVTPSLSHFIPILSSINIFVMNSLQILCEPFLSLRMLCMQQFDVLLSSASASCSCAKRGWLMMPFSICFIVIKSILTEYLVVISSLLYILFSFEL